MNLAAVHYRVEIANARAHQFRVTLTLPRPAAAQRLSLPVWVPGSYLVREMARHLSGLQATQRGVPVRLEQIDKTSWVAHCSGHAALVVTCLVYAFDASVRGAFLDTERGFFNASSLCLRAEGREAMPHTLQLGRLPAGWQVATAMPRTAGARQGYAAAGYDELIDHPFELGCFWRGDFRVAGVAGVAFEVAVTGAWPSFDAPRLLADMQRVCAAAITFWHGRGRPPFKPPFKHYVFLLNASEDGHGGLEHRASTALALARRELPRQGEADKGDADKSDGYVNLLGLVSHEFFHAWNVKRLRPLEFKQLDYTRENHSTLLWFFEGFTSYYDDLLLLRAGLIDAARYLRGLARHVSALAATPGRQVQSVAQASHDAWTKYYRADENTPNATVSYYVKGALVALALDLTLRAAQRGSLDDVMRLLWQRCAATGVTEADVAQAVQDVAGHPLQAELQAWVHGKDELPLRPLLQAMGVIWQNETTPLAQALGLRLAEGALSGVHVKAVLRGSAAEAAGLCAGDELLAVNGWRIRRFEDARQWLLPGQGFDVLRVRGQRVSVCRMQPAGEAAPAVTLLLASEPHVLRKAWLGV
jgi:predicted metalloprotease with PDZ domain